MWSTCIEPISQDCSTETSETAEGWQMQQKATLSLGLQPMLRNRALEYSVALLHSLKHCSSGGMSSLHVEVSSQPACQKVVDAPIALILPPVVLCVQTQEHSDVALA